MNKRFVDIINSHVDKASNNLEILKKKINEVISVAADHEFRINIPPFPYRKTFHNHIQNPSESDFLVLKINLENKIPKEINYPVILDVTFFMPRFIGPRSKKKFDDNVTSYHLVDPTLDLLNKTIVQCLESAERINKRHIVSLNSSKRYSDDSKGDGYIYIKIFKAEV